MKSIKVHVKRAALMMASITCVVFLFVYNLILSGGLFAPEDSPIGEKIEEVKLAEERKITTEGAFVDRLGRAITAAEAPGKPARILFDECYSYLIGYNCKMYGTSGLRKRLYERIFIGGDDGIGAEVTLTTDNDLQEFCYEILGESEGSVIVLRSDGALLACTSRSSAELGYNANLVCDDKELNRYSEYVSIDSFLLNRSTMSADPPGSTFKTVTGASMIENGMGDYVIDDPEGFVIIDGTKIHNYGGIPAGAGVDLEKALNDSVNVYFATAVQKLKAYNLQITADKFLLGHPIELDFATLMSNFDLDNMSNNVLLARTAFGQGRITMPPLQVAMIMNAIMNDGQMMKPYLVDHITDDGKVTDRTEAEVLSETMAPSTAEILKEYLHSTAEGYGYKEEDYGVIYAKTGTADQANGKNHAYMLMGVEDSPVGDCVILIDRRNISATSGSLKKDAESLLNYLLSMQG